MNNWIYRTFLLLIGLNLLFLCVLFLVYVSGEVVFIGFASSAELAYLSGCCIAVLLLTYIGVVRCKSFDMMWKRLGCIAFLLIFFFIGGLIAFAQFIFSGISGSYRSYSSPNGQHTIVLQHQSTFAKEWSHVYEMTSPFTMKEIGSNGSSGYSFDHIEIIWFDDHFIVTQFQSSSEYSYLRGD